MAKDDFLSGIDLYLTGAPRHCLVIAGGVIPPTDVPKLKRLGVAAVFGPGTGPADVVSFLRDRLGKTK